MKNKKISDVSDSAYCQSRVKSNTKSFENVNEKILEFIYKDNKKPRFFAVDGSQINLNKKMVKYGFRLSENREYCTGLLSSIYDIERKIPFNYELSNGHEGERVVLIRQLKYLKEGDTLIMDKGYYSLELLKELKERKINYIFRMKKSSTHVKQEKNDYLVNVKVGEKEKIQTRIIVAEPRRFASNIK